MPPGVLSGNLLVLKGNMMSSLNKLQLIGNLGSDPEIRYLPDGTPTAQLNVATTDSWKDKKTGEARESTEWHKVVFYRGLAEVAGKYLVKGSKLYVEGKLKTRKYTDKDGVERYITEVIGSEMIMLGGKRKDDSVDVDGAKYRDDQAGYDDIPF